MTTITTTPTIWTKKQCEEYRSIILERMKLHSRMTLDDDLPMKAFIEKKSQMPLSLYSLIEGNSYSYDMDDLKQNAFEQIGVICDAGEPMSIGTIQRDFSPHSKFNKDIPDETRQLFSYIVDNAQELVNEMIQEGLLEHIILQF